MPLSQGVFVYRSTNYHVRSFDDITDAITGVLSGASILTFILKVYDDTSKPTQAKIIYIKVSPIS